MLRKVSLVLSVIAALGLAFASSADAKPPDKGGNKSFHVNKNVHFNKNIHVNKTVHVNKKVKFKGSKSGKNYVVGKHYGSHIWFGRHRHRWHGVWYDYGVGPCWILVDDLWFWNELACPL